MNLELNKISSCLHQATSSLSAGKMDQACAHLSEAGNLLEMLVPVGDGSSEKPTAVKKPQQSEAPRALTATA